MQERLHRLIDMLIKLNRYGKVISVVADTHSIEIGVYDAFLNSVVFVHRKDRDMPKDNGYIHYIDDPELEQCEEYLKGVLENVA